MLERIKHEKTIDVYGHVTCLRAQRNYMVQTEDQYQFCYRAALEYLSSFDQLYPETQPQGMAVMELGVWNRLVILRLASRPLPPFVTLRLEFPPNSSPPRSTPNSPWSENFNNNVFNHLQPSHPIQKIEQHGISRIKRRRSSDQYKSERRNTFVINFNGFKNGFRPKNVGNRFFSTLPSQTAAEFSPPYAVPSNLISGTSWTSANGFHLTSHHQLNDVNPISTIHQSNSVAPFDQKDEEDPNKIIEIESDDSPPYLPSTAPQQRPKTVTPQPSPTAPPGETISERHDKSSLTRADFHHEEEPAFQFHLSAQKEELSC